MENKHDFEVKIQELQAEISALKQQNAGVVLPPKARPADGSYDYCKGHFDALREVARLNPPGECVVVPVCQHGDWTACAICERPSAQVHSQDDPTMVKVPRELLARVVAVYFASVIDAAHWTDADADMGDLRALLAQQEASHEQD